MRKLIIGVIIVIVLVVVFMRGDSLVQLIETMQRGAVAPLVIAIFTQLCKYFSQSFAFSNAFATVNETIRPRNTINLVFGMFFVNTVAPSVGVSGIALVVDDARKRGVPAGRATSAALLMQISIESGFLTIMIVGFLVLAFVGQFQPAWLIFTLVVVALVALMASFLIVGYKKPSAVLKVFVPIEGFVNRVLVRFKRKPIAPWAENLVNTFGDAAGRISRNPRKAVKVFLFSIVASTCELTCFILCGVGFGVTLLPALIGGYVVATLFAMISITPQGVGFVEAAILTMMTAFGIDAASAMAIGIVYRGLVFWMPFVIGAILINRTKTFGYKGKSGGFESIGEEEDEPSDSDDGDGNLPTNAWD